LAGKKSEGSGTKEKAINGREWPQSLARREALR
jgi:hypothetical protein